MNMKILLPILIFLAVIGVAVANANSQKAQVLSENEVIPTVAPTPQPSEKALKIASFAVLRMTEAQKTEFKKKYGDENMSDAEFIKSWSLKMDEDPTLMAQNEAIMEKHIASENQPVYYNTYETSEPSIDTNQINNNLQQQQLNNKIQQQQQQQQRSIEEQERAIKEQEREMDRLQNDMRWECISAGGVPVGNKCM